MATVYYPTGDCGTSGVVPQYLCSPCGTREYARIRSVAIYKKSSPFTNISSASEWTTKIAAGNARILWQVTGSLSNVTVEQLAGFGDVEFENGSTSWEAVIRDPNVVDNVDFYDALKLTSEWVLVYRTSSKIWDTGEACSISSKPVISDNLKDVVVYESTYKWVNSSSPVPYNTPTTIFEQCFTTT